MSYDEHTIPLGKTFYAFVNLPDKRLSLSPSVLSESYEVDAMQSISAGASCNVYFNTL